MTPNSFALFSLVAWPFVALYLYLSRPVSSATVWTILAAQLLLPVGTSFKFEMIPLFDKSSIPNLCALVGCWFFARRLPRLAGRMGITEVLVLLCVIGPVATSLFNGDDIRVGNVVLPGVGAYDGISAAQSQLIMLIPFFLGRSLLRNAPDTRQLLQIIGLAGVTYSLPLLFEIRFSPQLHFWVYGYQPSDFIQEVRENGSFRPMAFMGHGLIAAFFAMTATVASAALWRAQLRMVSFAPAGIVTAFLSTVLFLCKSGAALVYGVVLVPIIKWTKPRFQMRFAVTLVAIALLYPLMRFCDVFPTNTVIELSRAINQSRAGSMQFRFEQEEKLLEHASQRFLLGWGRYGRNRVFVANEWGVGADTSVTDGRWIITLGCFGIVGFLSEFGLLAISVLKAAKALKFTESFRDSIFLSALALIVAINIVDLLPNSGLSPWAWLLAGSLLGRSEMLLARYGKMNLRVSPVLTLEESRA